MNRTGSVEERALPSRNMLPILLGVLALPACESGYLTSVEEESVIDLALDTLDIEVQALWVRVSAVPADRQDLLLIWELDAETANPFWGPRVIRKSGRRSFESPDTARIWGNVPRAYDFRLVVSGLTPAGDMVTDTLTVVAPACRDPRRPTLLCNPRSTGSGSGSRGSTRSAGDIFGPGS